MKIRPQYEQISKNILHGWWGMEKIFMNFLAPAIFTTIHDILKKDQKQTGAKKIALCSQE